MSGQLGGDNNSDMTLFYNFTVKPVQNRLAATLTKHFRLEYPDWNVKTADWQFGDLTEIFKSETDKLYKSITQTP